LSRQSSQQQLIDLQQALSQAIADEAYEEAAKFRDQIKVFKQAEAVEMSSK
jgi:protein-arginine kinase activator protein McsA